MEGATEWKTKGNTALSSGNHTEAIDCYTKVRVLLQSYQRINYTHQSYQCITHYIIVGD